jgi:hypothetical protein
VTARLPAAIGNLLDPMVGAFGAETFIDASAVMENRPEASASLDNHQHGGKSEAD